MWNLNQDTGAVAGLRIAATCAAVRQADQNLDSLGDDIVGPVSVNVHDKTDTASVMFIPGMIEARRCGQALVVVVEHDGRTRFP